MDVHQLLGNAVRHLPLLAAGVDEEQIFLPVVEEAEIALRVVGMQRRCGHGRRRRARGVGALDDRRARRRAVLQGRVRLHKAVNPIERVGGDAAAVAQPRRELAVVHRAAAEGGFGQAGAPAIIGDFRKQLLCVHGTRP